MSLIITPGIGRKVWFYKSAQHALDCKAGHDQPYDATVVFVHNDHHVNLRVTDHYGNDSPAVGVDLVQPGDKLEPNGPHARWMDYQIEQALVQAVREAMEAPVNLKVNEAGRLQFVSNDDAADEVLHSAVVDLGIVSDEITLGREGLDQPIVSVNETTGEVSYPDQIDTTAKQVESLSEQSDTAGNVPFAESQALGEPL